MRAAAVAATGGAFAPADASAAPAAPDADAAETPPFLAVAARVAADTARIGSAGGAAGWAAFERAFEIFPDPVRDTPPAAAFRLRDLPLPARAPFFSVRMQAPEGAAASASSSIMTTGSGTGSGAGALRWFLLVFLIWRGGEVRDRCEPLSGQESPSLT